MGRISRTRRRSGKEQRQTGVMTYLRARQLRAGAAKVAERTEPHAVE
jgi:hypothetical protein